MNIYVPVLIISCFSTVDKPPSCTKELVDQETASIYQTPSHRVCQHAIKEALIKHLQTIAKEEGKTLIIDHMEVVCGILKQKEA